MENDPTKGETRSLGKRKRLSRKDQKIRRKKKHKHGNVSNRAISKEGSSSPSTSTAPPPSSSWTDRPVPPTEEEISASYVPTAIPTWNEIKEKHQKCPSLGKWFPKAIVLKSCVHYTNADVRRLQKAQQQNSTTAATALPRASVLLFYQYVDPQWPVSRVDLLIAYLIQIFEHRSNLGGRIRVAREGLNVTLSAVDRAAGEDTCAMTLRHFARDLQRFDPVVFAMTDFKYIDHVQADRHFKDLKIFPVQELVFYGFGSGDDRKGGSASSEADLAPLCKTGVHLQPQDFHNMLGQDASTTVVIDVRNHYEAALGRFDGQQHSTKLKSAPNGTNHDNDGDNDDDETKAQRGTTSVSGAEYIDPKMRKSTDFSRWLAKSETKDKLKNKNVLLFCTGGVRCERASAYLNNTMGHQVKGVYQLQGGIERYLQEFPDGGHWRGKNFVFDKREACGAGDKDGDGGVVERHKKKTRLGSDKGTSGIETKCCLCNTHWDRYVGKKKCSTCGVPVLMCDSCLSNKKKQSEMLARCALCVEENVTVRAEQVEWTNNGADISHSSADKSSGDAPQSASLKVAPSVLKWGGGHASNKRDRRRFQRTPCRFGAGCARKDCFFAHPKMSETTGK